MKYYDPSIEEDVLTLFNEVVVETYQRFNINVKTDFTKLTSADFPTFSDVYTTIRGRILSYGEATRERDIMEKLEIKVRPLISGGLEHYFNGHTTYNSGTIVITQQPSDFAAPDVLMQGKAIFDNASYYLVMGLKKQAVEDLSRLIDLNDNEKENIKRYNQGDALFVCGSKRMQISVIATDAELDSFGTRGGL